MNSSSCKRLEVFDFKEEEEDGIPEMVASRSLEKFKNPKNPNSYTPGITKYKVLEYATRRDCVKAMEIGNAQCVDVDAMDTDDRLENATSLTLLGVGEDSAGKQRIAPSDSNIGEENGPFEADDFRPGSSFPVLQTDDSNDAAASPCDPRLNSIIPESPASNDQVGLTSDADESLKESTSSSPASSTAEDGASLQGQNSDDGFGNWDMGDIDTEVAFCPDYFVFRDEYSTEAVVTFSGSCIKIKGSTVSEKKGTLNLQWGLADIIDIESQWCGRIEVAMVRLHVISKDAVQADSASSMSRIEEVKFAVVDPNWFDRQEAIRSLHEKYKSIWNIVLDPDMDGDAFQNNFVIQNSYFPKFDDHFEEVIYPKGDSDAVSISKRDIDLLQPETFINDTIIDFYIKYLKNKIQPGERHRFHFFNSFFFRKLADLDKDPSSASEGKAAFLRVRKWTRKVDLFGKDFIFIPVNFNLHWSLLVICHPGDAANFKDEDVFNSLRVPCILHMDSIKGSHTGLKNIVQSYLWEEWKERHKEVSEELSSKFFNFRFVPLELPQQENSFDCGLFLLHFVELFLEDAPVNFNPFKITKFSNFLNVDWFPPAEASLKRALIQRLIFELLENHSGESSPAACSDEPLSPKYLGRSNGHETGVDFIEETYNPVEVCHGNLLSSRVDQGIEITLLTSSLRTSQCVNDSSLVLREFFEPGATAGSFLDGQYQSLDQTSFHRLESVMSPIEEEEPGDQFVYSSSCENGFQQLAGIAPEACGIHFTSRDLDNTWNPGISVEQEGHEAAASSPEASTGASEDSLEVGVDGSSMVRDDTNPSQIEMRDQPRSPEMENMECLTQDLARTSVELLEISVVESSQDTVKIDNGNDGNDVLPSYQENLLTLIHPTSGKECNDDITCNNVQLIDHELVSYSDEQRASKRQRLTPPYEGETELTGSPSKDLHL